MAQTNVAAALECFTRRGQSFKPASFALVEFTAAPNRSGSVSAETLADDSTWLYAASFSLTDSAGRIAGGATGDWGEDGS